MFSLLCWKFIFRIRVWNGHVILAKAEHSLFLSLVLQGYRILVCGQLLVMIVIAGRLSLLGFVFKPVSWLAGDSRLRQTFSLGIHLGERQSLSPICPSTIILLATGPLKPPFVPALAGLSPVLLYFC